MTGEERERLRAEIDQRRRERCRMVPRVRHAATEFHRRAGATKVERLREAFATLRVATQADARREAGIDSGTATWAIRALLHDGVIEPTGRIIERSPEFALGPADN